MPPVIDLREMWLLFWCLVSNFCLGTSRGLCELQSHPARPLECEGAISGVLFSCLLNPNDRETRISHNCVENQSISSRRKQGKVIAQRMPYFQGPHPFLYDFQCQNRSISFLKKKWENWYLCDNQKLVRNRKRWSNCMMNINDRGNTCQINCMRLSQ